MPQVTWRSIATLLIAVTLWGFAPVGNRYLVVRFDPLAILALRFTIASLAFVPMLRGLRRCPRDRRVLTLLAISGVIGICGYNLPVMIGQQTTSAGMAGLIIASEPIWILLIWCLFERRWPGLRSSAGALIGLTGIVLIISAQHDLAQAVGTDIWGPVLILISAMAWSLYCVLMREVSAAFGPVRATALTIQIGTLPMLLIGAGPAVALAVDLSVFNWIITVGLTLGSTVIAVLLWNRASAEIGATKAGPFLYLIPVVSIAGGMLFLGEQQPLQVLVGGAVVLGGVILASTQAKPVASPTPRSALARANPAESDLSRSTSLSESNR